MTEKDEQSLIAEIKKLHSELQGLATGAFDRVIRIGELLLSVKSALGHGRWLLWLESNVSFSERTAQNYMRVFQNQARLKSANIADLARAYLELEVDKSSDQLKEQRVEHAAHSEFLESVRKGLESPQSPSNEELKGAYQARLSSCIPEFAEACRKRGIVWWTLAELEEDPELLEAFEAIYAAYGFDGTIRFLAGLNGFDREDVIYLASLGTVRMLELACMVMDRFWPGKFRIDFLDKAPTKNSTLDEIHDRCLADCIAPGKGIAITVDGFLHTCELQEPPWKPWWDVAFHPDSLSEILTKDTTIDELNALCMTTNERHIWGHIGKFNHSCKKL
jgi:Protein of unknown function (DUF3102)